MTSPCCIRSNTSSRQKKGHCETGEWSRGLVTLGKSRSGATMVILDRIVWTRVNWVYVAVLTALVFFSTLICALLSFHRVFRSAVPSALRLAAAFVVGIFFP